jgi:glycosyltransferase involved in cell wall biosynthesis
MSKDQPKQPSYCVIIPTYNNEKTLKRVIDGVLEYISSDKIIIVNDGSTDTTAAILKQYPEITQIHFPENKGKGIALRKGFKKALELEFTHAVTIDSDGQHFPDDIPLLISSSQIEPETLIIGSRNMKQEGVPAKSSFGNKFSNFWFWFETGIKLVDTQSGFRLYPISLMPKKWFTRKFEFEIECIVRSAWKGIPVKNIPIQIKYDEKERVSHFRPFQDFSRISVLNTVLVAITILYIIPRSFFRIFKKKSLREFIKQDLLGSDDSPKVKSLSLALGVFIGIIPIWGFQTIVVLFLAVSLKLNKLLAFAATNISIPPMIPLIVIAALKIGSIFLNSEIEPSEVSSIMDFKNHLLEYLVGSIILAVLAAVLTGFFSYFLLKRFEKNKKTV